jgi:hypothetical protein
MIRKGNQMSYKNDKLHLDDYGFVVECDCGDCGERFPVNVHEGYNYSLCVHFSPSEGRHDTLFVWAPHCPFCDLENNNASPAATETLSVEGVDLELLEEQRKSLQRVIGCLHGMVGYTLLGITAEDVENLEGLENMLDTWSDERYFAKTKQPHDIPN